MGRRCCFTEDVDQSGGEPLPTSSDRRSRPPRCWRAIPPSPRRPGTAPHFRAERHQRDRLRRFGDRGGSRWSYPVRRNCFWAASRSAHAWWWFRAVARRGSARQLRFLTVCPPNSAGNRILRAGILTPVQSGGRGRRHGCPQGVPLETPDVPGYERGAYLTVDLGSDWTPDYCVCNRSVVCQGSQPLCWLQRAAPYRAPDLNLQVPSQSCPV